MRRFAHAAVVVAGAPLLALGVGTATAWADTSSTSTDTRTTRQPGNRDLAVSVAGIPVVKSDTSEAFSRGLSIAIASNNSEAGAMGFGSVSIATNNSYSAAAGLLNTAIAVDNSDASAGYSGIGNTAIARNGSSAGSYDGHFNTVRATNNSSAQVDIGSFNTVRATDGSTALTGGNASIITARCGGSVLNAQSHKIVASAPCEAG